MKLQDIIKLNQTFEFDYLGQDRELAQQIQIRLRDLKLLSGVADGAYGPITKQATVKFAQAFDLPELLNAAFAEKLIEAIYVPNCCNSTSTSIPNCGVELIKRFCWLFSQCIPRSFNQGGTNHNWLGIYQET